MNMQDMKCREFKTKQKREDIVKIFFYSNYVSRKTKEKVWRCYLYIGTNIISRLNWKENDFIRIIRLNDEDKILTLHKRNDNDLNPDHKLFKGFKLRKVKGSYSYSISFVWDDQDEIIDNSEMQKNLYTTPHEIIKGDNEDYIKIHYYK